MNREIKFRVYIPKTKTLHYMKTGKNPIVEIDFVRQKISILKESSETIDKIETYNFEDVRIMQFIGVKNDYGEELYEGDIFYDEVQDENGYIGYDNAEIKLIYERVIQSTDNDELITLDIIGDIYTIKDNYPERLEEWLYNERD